MKLKYILTLIWILSLLINIVMVFIYDMYSEFWLPIVFLMPLVFSFAYQFTKENKDNIKRLEKLKLEEKERELVRKREKIEANIKRTKEEVKINSRGIIKFLLGLGVIILSIFIIIALGPLWIIAIILTFIFIVIVNK